MRVKWAEVLPEIIVGVVLLVFAAGFKSWSVRLKDTSQQILEKLSSLSREFHQHVVKTENRVTKVEEKVNHLEKRGEGD